MKLLCNKNLFKEALNTNDRYFYTNDRSSKNSHLLNSVLLADVLPLRINVPVDIYRQRSTSYTVHSHRLIVAKMKMDYCCFINVVATKENTFPFLEIEGSRVHIRLEIVY